jgi:hypothetical protein
MGCLISCLLVATMENTNQPVKSVTGGPHYPNFTRPRPINMVPPPTRRGLGCMTPSYNPTDTTTQRHNDMHNVTLRHAVT